MSHLAVAVMPTDIKPDPVEVGFFSTQDIVKVASSLPDLVTQAKILQRRVAGFHDSVTTG